MESLKSGLRKDVPAGVTVLFTVTAPIRLASKTAADLEVKIRHALQRGSPGRDRKYTIHGNRVRVRLVGHGRARTSKVLGFVHNPDADPARVLDTAGDPLAVRARRGATGRLPAKNR